MSWKERFKVMIRILIVEDDAALREHLADLLARQGYSVAVAENSHVAHEALKRAAADIMIIDVFLPDKDGLALMLEIRRVHPGIKVILTSGRQHLLYGESLRFALKLGADRILSKPFTTEGLLHCVRELTA
jgi:DNA-binding response OmpR family regulator